MICCFFLLLIIIYCIYNRENASLKSSLESQTDNMEDKKSLVGQLEKAKAAVGTLGKFNESLAEQTNQLTKENTDLKSRLANTLLSMSGSGKDDQKIKALQQDNERLKNERDSLQAMLQQKDALLQLQGNVHENDANNKYTTMIRELKERVVMYETQSKELDDTKRSRAELERALNAANARLQQLSSNDSSMDVLALRAENWQLREQLDITYRESLAAKDELKAANDAMQREFAALWLSVQELNKLDVMKDKSIQDLIADRDRSINDYNQMAEKYNAKIVENEALRNELEVRSIVRFLVQIFSIFHLLNVLFLSKSIWI